MAHHAPATSGIFSFADDFLFVEAAGKNLHRRATIPELRAHFDASDDRPAHWYEAQLIHYGLPSSRVKGTAKMRLYDAVKRGDLAVPAYMKSMEKNLKKVWQDGVAANAAATRKRKVDTQTNVPVAKAPRTTQEASRGGATRVVVSREEVSILSASFTPRARQTARRGGSSSAAGGSSGPWGYDPHPSYLDNIGSYPSYADDFDEAYYYPDDDDDEQSQFLSPVGYDDSESEFLHPEVHIPPDFDRARPLGLINGNYVILDTPWDSPDPPGDYISPHSLVLTLEGDRVWGSLDLGDTTGIIHLDLRPYEAGPDRLGITWRGHCTDPYGFRRLHDGSHSAPCQYLSFLGGGEIRGAVRYGRGFEDFHEFWGYRTSGQETRSPISAREMRERWADLLPRYY